jgi:hypothetical protein
MYQVVFRAISHLRNLLEFRPHSLSLIQQTSLLRSPRAVQVVNPRDNLVLFLALSRMESQPVYHQVNLLVNQRTSPPQNLRGSRRPSRVVYRAHSLLCNHLASQRINHCRAQPNSLVYSLLHVPRRSLLGSHRRTLLHSPAEVHLRSLV